MKAELQSKATEGYLQGNFLFCPFYGGRTQKIRNPNLMHVWIVGFNKAEFIVEAVLREQHVPCSFKMHISKETTAVNQWQPLYRFKIYKFEPML